MGKGHSGCTVMGTEAARHTGLLPRILHTRLPPVLVACWVYSRPQTAHGHRLPAYHAFHRGRREPAGLAPNLCETRFYAKECFDGPAWPGCRLCPVRAVIRNCPVLENSSCQMTKDLYLTCQHRPPGSLPKTHATGPHHRCRNPERGHGPPWGPQLCVITAVSSSSSCLGESHRHISKGFRSWLLLCQRNVLGPHS